MLPVVRLWAGIDESAKGTREIRGHRVHRQTRTVGNEASVQVKVPIPMESVQSSTVEVALQYWNDDMLPFKLVNNIELMYQQNPSCIQEVPRCWLNNIEVRAREHERKPRVNSWVLCWWEHEDEVCVCRVHRLLVFQCNTIQDSSAPLLVAVVTVYETRAAFAADEQRQS